MPWSGSSKVKIVIATLALLLVALSSVALVLYSIQQEAASRLDHCRAVLASTREDLVGLARYSESLYRNYTVLYNYTVLLVANYTKLYEDYLDLLRKYETTLRMLENYAKLADELRTSNEKLDQEISKLRNEVAILSGAFELVKQLRNIYLEQKPLEYFTHNNTTSITGSTTADFKLVASRELYMVIDGSPRTLNIPTPKPGYVVLRISIDYYQEFCIEVRAVNTYIVLNYSERSVYLTVQTCSKDIELLIPVLPHTTVIEIVSPGFIPTGRIPLAKVEVRYLAIYLSTE